MTKSHAAITDYTAEADRILALANNVEGLLSEKEIRFLTLLGAYPSAPGGILEIGSFKGKSTVILSKSAALAGDPHLSAVDPLCAPSITDPDLKGAASSEADFRNNLKKADVEQYVDFHKMTSNALAKKWSNPLRLLWIDGDHTYAGTKADFDNFSPHLSDKGIIAIHDVLHEFDGSIRVFCEDILLSKHFGPCGLVGSIGWGQYCTDPEQAKPYYEHKRMLYRKACKLIPSIVLNNKLDGINKLYYKILRARIPHGAMPQQHWLKIVG